MWKEIELQISQHSNQLFKILNYQSVSGGCINQAYKLIGKQDKNYFIKLNQASAVEMFRVEALGLKEIAATNTINVPLPICWGVTQNQSYLVLDWLDLIRCQNWLEMGRNLAKLHQQQKYLQYGWHINNTIGSTPQINTWCDNWADFFAENRIGYQLHLANRRGGNFGDEKKIISAVKKIVANHHPQPSLLHGDLWSGNVAFTIDNQPVIFDPAFYIGDRETDIAMSEVFGGFPATFYQGYNQEWQLDEGYQQRKNLYNLYHILNHFNLFGFSYASQAASMIRQIFSQLN